ncbi:DEAD/DEAH box helicase [Mucilaginibacter phyllosphaerae]|uniref:DEAD-box ATP-dependent RNA helicase RhpA n=1 Tax=Mucilaginibacter phyllosphaerae TaxID=1812349 RepID=A0A4Y8AK11_9SPHI|nr:DEAD/DEAH box helicase [Mucilaginibacter phyllosphaerae]MBB3967600.1 ATP-dependent RNA helicase RhlE [Mucilaginibacter phyllosphaerae]TEW69343.1 DEAD/DEAH box helicase [Mucilaginibacter phyllosphaerae]GGH21623.1 DEAD/DEAH box family ATP-dependent RNA helicase [Mucilaginibacter phyllosphaerae]
MSFENLNLIEPILRALKTEGYTNPTPIQEQAIPYILQHRDLLGCAQTGTGKTAAFAIPILQLLFLDKQKHKEQKQIKALILTPTRELAIQISESFTAYGKHTGLKNLVIFGGVSQNPQVDALRRGVDILIATPGRLLDLMNQRYVHIDQIKMLILDEADRMLDMGFVNDVKKIIAKVPANRQTLFFSATMPNEIQSLADSILQKPARVEVAPVSSTADTIQQALFYVSKNDKRLLLNHILKDKDIKTALVFTRTKHGADKVVKDLIKAGITAEAIHGNKSQNARQRALTNFKNRTTRVLIATDIAARGIDIDELTHVINYEIPNIPETYVHRIGRTGRAGASGIALTFCDGEEEIDYLKDIHKLIAKEIPVELGHPYPLSYEAMTAKMMSKAKNGTPKSATPAGGRHGGGNKRAGAGGRPAGHRGGSGGAGNSRGGASGMSGASRSSSGRR